MAGHNKWAKVKRAKAVTDKRRGKVFSRLSRDIAICAKAGGGDPGMNPRLRTLVLKAREVNMPAENVDRAIKKGTGELPGVVYEDVIYEGYGPGGVAFILHVLTDNKNRAAGEIRSILTRFGGKLGTVANKFQHLGQFLVAKDKSTEDALMELALEAGADDVITSEQGYEIRCAVKLFDHVNSMLEQKGVKPDSAEIAYIPLVTAPIEDIAIARTLLKLQDAFEELDDVQEVFSNEEMSDAVSEAAQKG
ncbi:MAG: YebC/PmpR family DNA-binding transcriptional regulator [Opitutaceae bacterium]|nr:YebC/PmpR family DNA-binding transcriptional regulator [Opitutaceae bacterium]